MDNRHIKEPERVSILTSPLRLVLRRYRAKLVDQGFQSSPAR